MTRKYYLNKFSETTSRLSYNLYCFISCIYWCSQSTLDTQAFKVISTISIHFTSKRLRFPSHINVHRRKADVKQIDELINMKDNFLLILFSFSKALILTHSLHLLCTSVKQSCIIFIIPVIHA